MAGPPGLNCSGSHPQEAGWVLLSPPMRRQRQRGATALHSDQRAAMPNDPWQAEKFEEENKCVSYILNLTAIKDDGQSF